MKKRYLLLIIIVLFVAVGCSKKEVVETDVIELVPLLSKYKGLELDKVKSLEVIKYSEGGSEENTYTDEEQILELYNSLDSMKVGEEIHQSCDDNTTIYNFMMKDGNKISVVLECEWVVINGKKYMISI